MRAMLTFTLKRELLEAASGQGGTQKGAQYKAAFGRGYPWYAGPSLVIAFPRAGCCQAEGLIEAIAGDYLLADKGYDSIAILGKVFSHGRDPVIPPKRNTQPLCDKDGYKLRRIVETGFWILRAGEG